MRAAAFVVVTCLAAVAAACGGSGTSPTAQHPRGRTATDAAPALSPAAFAAAEDEILHHLAALDPRVAARASLVPTEDDRRRVAMAAVLNEDSSVALVDGRLDPFSFDARARGLVAAQAKVAVLPLDAMRPSERESLSDLVDSEMVRLDEERALPRSAASLVRAIVVGWQPPKNEKDVAEVDRWLARRLTGVREAIAAQSDPALALDVVRARDLDDALDALERLATAPGFTASTQELVRLREVVEAAASHPAARAHADWSRTARRLRAHLGVVARGDELVRDLALLEVELRSRAGSAPVAVDERQLFTSGRCADAVPESRVRSMAAAPEREPACHLRHLVAESPAGSPAAIAAMHEHVVVAQWAVDVARGASTIAVTEGRHRFLSTVSPELRSHYERIALARPVSAIGAALTVKILMTGDPRERAVAWSRLGDVPLDVAMRELAR